jgi:hypothetical protein
MDKYRRIWWKQNECTPTKQKHYNNSRWSQNHVGSKISGFHDTNSTSTWWGVLLPKQQYLDPFVENKLEILRVLGLIIAPLQNVRNKGGRNFRRRTHGIVLDPERL